MLFCCNCQCNIIASIKCLTVKLNKHVIFKDVVAGFEPQVSPLKSGTLAPQPDDFVWQLGSRQVRWLFLSDGHCCCTEFALQKLGSRTFLQKLALFSFCLFSIQLKIFSGLKCCCCCCCCSNRCFFGL